VSDLGWLIVVFALLFGLAIGSFLNVVVYRVPRGLSLSSPPSACPSCGHPIRWRDNIPVLSWLWLRGRCRDCANPVSARYPLIEGATGLAVAAAALAVVLIVS
jgi:leader peptidase (prepilin peptidase)/N-methyltransferase